MTCAAGAVLVADIGGTNARFALARAAAPVALDQASIVEYPVAQFPSLAAAAAHYLQQSGADVRSGVFAVAGRVDGDEARITNHPWVISRPRISAALGLERLHLINDFVAQAMSITLLQATDVVQIGAPPWQPGSVGQSRNYCVIGPGTGLGVGGLVLRNGRSYPLATEGGHASFPPGTPEEVRILEILTRQFGRVSNERLVCGPGLANIHRALSEIAGTDPGQLQPADITARAGRGDALSLRAIDVFLAVFGAISGDAVLVQGAWDGVFLTGGLVPRMLEGLQHSGFRQRFENKGRFSAAMAQIPVLAIIHPCPGLLGATAYAIDALHDLKGDSP
ncbi:glucokinase [Stenotrophomonas sp. YIM B06876]|uniref:glucokinase n=1 Tax=Stenotrophomonas sp. YIM B06876 TaxID=3060211 RepID=UPI002739A61A|nr:glucokinase [Stenotrophomonas sp. YIM B06876]